MYFRSLNIRKTREITTFSGFVTRSNCGLYHPAPLSGRRTIIQMVRLIGSDDYVVIGAIKRISSSVIGVESLGTSVCDVCWLIDIV